MASAPGQRDLYEILDVAVDADAEAIRAAHRRRARELHPDVNTATDAHERMSELNHARDVLLDGEARARYDRSRPRPRVGPAGMRRGRPVTGGERASGIHFTFTTDKPLSEEERVEEEPPPTGDPARWRFDPRAGAAQEDWYAFLDVHPWSTPAEMQAAVRGLVGQSIAKGLAPDEQARRQAKLRMAWEVLGNPRRRAEYDRERPPWQPPSRPPDFYAALGLARSATTEMIGEAVTEQTRELGDRAWNAELRAREAELRQAWWVLRDASRRARYDAALTTPT